jgi:hypothetical protein
MTDAVTEVSDRADTVSAVAVSLMASTITVNRGFRWMRSG